MREAIAERFQTGIGTIRRSPFARNALSLSLATVTGQGLVVAASPLLSRLYTPADFGILALYSSALSVLVSVCSLRYELAIATADTEEAALDLMTLTFILVIASGLATLLGYSVVHGLLRGHSSAAAERYLWILPLGVIGGGLFQSLSYWSIRQREVRSLARTRVAQNASQVMLQVGAGLVSATPWGLVGGDAVGRSIGAGTLWSSLPARELVTHRRSVRSLLNTAKRYREYPMLMMGASLLNMTALQVPLLLIPTSFGVAAAGVYFLAFRVLVMPTTTIGTAVGQVFLGEAANVSRSAELLRGKSLKLARVLMVINAPIFIAVTCAGSTLFAFVFGEKWQAAGHFAEILAPMALLWSLANPLSGLLLVGKRLKESLFFSAADLTVKVAGIAMGAHFDNIDIAVIAISAAGTVLGSVSAWRFLRVAKIGFGELVLELLQSLACSIPLAVATLLASATLSARGVLLVVVVMLPATWALGWQTRVRAARA